MSIPVIIMLICAILMIINIILIVKLNFFHVPNRRRAIKYIFSQKNYRELDEKYLYEKSFNDQYFNLLMWTYKQQFKGLEDENHRRIR